MTAEAIRYYFPALVRVALDPNLKGEFRIEVRSVVQAGNLALVRSDWRLKGTGPGGCQVDISGRGVEAVLRRLDGTWL